MPPVQANARMIVEGIPRQRKLVRGSGKRPGPKKLHKKCRLETERSFKTCEALLERFWAEIGLDLRLEPFKPGTKTYKDRIVGTTGNGTVTPSPQWIGESEICFLVSL